MEKEIITSFIIIAQIEVSAGEAFQVILCVSFELVSLTCLGVSKQKPPHEKDYYLSVRFGCPFFWQVCWMCGWKTFGFCSIGSSEKLALAVSIMWYELSSVGFYFILFLIKMCDPRCIYYCLTWVGYLSFLKFRGLFVCNFLFLAL